MPAGETKNEKPNHVENSEHEHDFVAGHLEMLPLRQYKHTREVEDLVEDSEGDEGVSNDQVHMSHGVPLLDGFVTDR